jgi:hypothetical protein
LIGVRQWTTLAHVASIFSSVNNVDIKTDPTEKIPDEFPEDLKLEFEEMMRYFEEFGYDAGKVDDSVVQPEDVSSIPPIFYTYIIAILPSLGLGLC